MIGPTIPDLEIFMKATTAQMSYILAGRQLGFIIGNALGTLFILNKIFLIFFAGDHRNLLHGTRAQPFLPVLNLGQLQFWILKLDYFRSSLVLRLLNILL